MVMAGEINKDVVKAQWDRAVEVIAQTCYSTGRYANTTDDHRKNLASHALTDTFMRIEEKRRISRDDEDGRLALKAMVASDFSDPAKVDDSIKKYQGQGIRFISR